MIDAIGTYTRQQPCLPLEAEDDKGLLYSEFALSNELDEQIIHTGILAAAA